MKTTEKTQTPLADSALAAARQALVEAELRVELADASLLEAHDAGKTDGIVKAEQALANARTERDRAQKRLEAAERRFAASKVEAAARARATGAERLRAVCRERLELAQRIDQAYEQLGSAIARLGELDVELLALQRAGIASSDAVLQHNFGANRIRVLLSLAAARARLPGADLPAWSKDGVPSTSQLVTKDNATLLLDVGAGDDA